jgi:uncharacterized protein YbjT (DUF2867 family)
MKILLTGANGYIGKRLLPALVEERHSVVCLVRDANRLAVPSSIKNKVDVMTGDLLEYQSLKSIPDDVDIAFYLVHSMSHTATDFSNFERVCAENFVKRVTQTNAKQIIYLSGIVNDENLSTHLKSRLNVEAILSKSEIPLTTLRAGIIIGSGSASFEIIRDLVEKLPVMIAPKWVNNRIQPIAIYNVIYYLKKVIGNAECYNKTFDIGGPDILNYKEMMLQFAKVRGFKRLIINVPVLSPRLSSYWLYFVTSTSFSLAQSLVDSLKNEVVCQNDVIKEIIPHECIGYEEAVKRAFSKIAENTVISSWKDAWITGTLHGNYNDFIQVPRYGCLVDQRKLNFEKSPQEVLETVWSIGGSRGWYGQDWLWKIRGFLDKIAGGVGLRRGRTNQNSLKPGDALDFWRVILADKDNMRLLLYAEMKLPGEAWLEFKIVSHQKGGELNQTATFRPNGLFGRLYWYSILPFHSVVFGRMISNIIKHKSLDNEKKNEYSNVTIA